MSLENMKYWITYAKNNLDDLKRFSDPDNKDYSSDDSKDSIKYIENALEAIEDEVNVGFENRIKEM